MENAIHKISLIGYGNVGSHLAKEFVKCNVEVTHIYLREHSGHNHSETGALFVHRFEDLPEDQTVIICVPDDAILNVLTEIHSSYSVAYTSGAIAINSLPQRENIGVLYPLQTFSKGVPVNIFEVPFFIEASNEHFASLLFDLAWKISRNVHYANSEDRKDLHLAAVWINNFTNHIGYIAKTYLEKRDLSFDHLKPLLAETVNKLIKESPFDAQTGPARRGDTKVIEQHLSKMEGIQKDIYRLISESIKTTYQND